jgi:hypothetical protein
MKKEYYTYAWLREDRTPYYVGKGIGNRAYRSHKRGNSYMSAPPRDRIIFLKKNLTEFDAYKHENYIISILGIKEDGGILINMSYGGEGSSGRKPSEYCIQRTKEVNIGKILTEEHKKKVSQQVSQRKWWNNGKVDKHTIECPGKGWVLGRLFNTKCETYKTKEFSEKSRKNNLGKSVSDETRKKQSKVRKGRKWWNNGERTKLCYECPGDEWTLGRPGHLIN